MVRRLVLRRGCVSSSRLGGRRESARRAWRFPIRLVGSPSDPPRRGFPSLGFWRSALCNVGKWCCREELNLRPRPYQGRALPLSYGSGPGKAGGTCHRAPGIASAMTPTRPQPANPGFHGLFHRLAKIWSSFRHGPGILRGRALGRDDSHVQAQVLAQQAALAEAAQGRYPRLHAFPVRAFGPPPGCGANRALTAASELIFQDQRVDMTR